MWDFVHAILIFIFFIITVAVGFYAKRHVKDVGTFVLGGRNVGPWLTAFSYGATYFSAVVFIGYAGMFGWAYGISAVWIGLGNVFIGSLVAWKLLGRRARIMTKHLSSNTMPDFFASRYDSKPMRTVAAIIVFIFLIPYSASVFNGLSYLFTSALGMDRIEFGYEICIVAMSLLTALYVILGGYMSNVINDTIQGFVMLVGIVLVIGGVLNDHGGLMGSLTELSKFSAPNSEMHGVYSSFLGPEPLNLLGVVILTSLGAWGLPQMVQKFYSIKDEKSVKAATIISTVFALFVAGGSYFLGAFGRIFVSPEEATNAITGKFSTDMLMPIMLEKAVSPVIISVIIILVLSASISTLSSLVLSSSSTITLDLIAPSVKKEMSEKKKITWIRVFLAIFILISMLLAIYSYRTNDMYIAKLMSISWGALSGSFIAPFLYGLFWKGVTKAAVWASFISGVGITVIHLILSNGALFGHSFAFPTGLAINLASPINAGAFAMLFGLILVPVVSWITPKIKNEVIEHAFEGYDIQIAAEQKKMLPNDDVV
ncbi:MAG: sodium:solute symporter family protein [Clostridiales bacterium]|nr:sodium:solute symporter family protein [Clostridiales bacterium]